MVHHIHKLSPVTKVVLGGLMALSECAMHFCELAFTNGLEEVQPLMQEQVAIEQTYCGEEGCPV
jgi:hypothetical protein